MSTVTVNKENFADTIRENDIVLVDFWAAWCGPCRAFAPVYNAASERHDGVVFAKVDTEAEPELAQAFQIMSIPTLVAFREQVLLLAQPGALGAGTLDDLIGQIQALDMDAVRREVEEASDGRE